MRDGATIPDSQPSMGELEVEAFTRVLQSGHPAEGQEVQALEQEVAAVVGKRHGVAVSSGTCALLLAKLVLGAGPGDEVLVTNYVWTAFLHAVRANGATPIVCDIDARTRNLESVHVEPHLSPRSRAIVLPHMFGLTQDASAFSALAGSSSCH